MAAVLGTSVGAWCSCSGASGPQRLAEPGRVTRRRLCKVNRDVGPNSS